MSAARRVSLAAACAVVMLAGGLARAETVAASLTSTPGNGNRLVLDLMPPNGWAVQQFEDLIEVRFPGVAADIALPTALRPPLAEVSTERRDGETFLRFVVTCACALAVSGRGRSALLLDFVRTESPGPAMPAPLHAPAPVAKGEAPAVGAPPETGREDGGIDVAEARERLMQQLLRAAEAGLIEINPAETAPGDTAEAGPEPEFAAGAPEAPAAAPAEGGGASPADGQVVRSDAHVRPVAEAGAPAPEARDGAVDAVADAGTDSAAAARPKSSAADAAGTPPQQPAECHSPEMFKLAQPESGATWVAHVADLRGSLAGEFDRVEPAGVFELARTYIAGGFGAEAASVLDQFGDGGAEAVLLAELAGLVDGHAPGDEASIWRADCLGPQALWRALASAMRGDTEDAMAAEAASGRALERLPTPIRQDAAARLGLAAADAGAWETARRMQAMVSRSNADPAGRTGRALLLSARLARWADMPDVAARELSRARARDPEVAADATLLLAQEVLRTGTPGQAGLSGLIADLGVLSRLQRGGEAGARAAEFEVMLTALADGRRAALDTLTLGLARDTFDEKAFTSILARVAQRPGVPDGQSVASIYLADPRAFGPAMADPRFREILARSLIDLGLPDQAAGLFDGGGLPAPVMAPLAEAYLATGDPRAAMETIAEMPDTDDRRRLHAAATAEAGGAMPPVLRRPDEGAPADGAPSAEPDVAAIDLAGSLDRALDRLDGQGGAAAAETAALLALAMGESEIPAAAASVLGAEYPERLARLKALFVGDGSSAPADPQAVGSFLSRLDTEISIIEDMLTDG